MRRTKYSYAKSCVYSSAIKQATTFKVWLVGGSIFATINFETQSIFVCRQ